MSKYEIVSLDIFQTLVNVNERIPEIWKGVLGDSYTEGKATTGVEAIFQHFPSAYELAANSDTFMTMEEVYHVCCKNVADQINFNANYEDIAYHLMLQHGYSPFYEEVLECLEQLKKQYKVIISSDSNPFMVEQLRSILNIEDIFISEDVGFYKGDKDGRFFDKVVSQLGISPEKIIHIGDSSSDIIGAHKKGITSCWINRENRTWNHQITPDITIQNMNEIFSYL